MTRCIVKGKCSYELIRRRGQSPNVCNHDNPDHLRKEEGAEQFLGAILIACHAHLCGIF